MNFPVKTSILLFCLVGMIIPTKSQELTAETFDGLKFRSLGPAFTSGRIADIAVHPENENIWSIHR